MMNLRSTGRSMLHKTAKVEFHPLGVIGAIVSWNYPFHNIFNPMLAAVFSGNGVVIKVFKLCYTCTILIMLGMHTISWYMLNLYSISIVEFANLGKFSSIGRFMNILSECWFQFILEVKKLKHFLEIHLISATT